MLVQNDKRFFIKAPDLEMKKCPVCQYYGKKDMDVYSGSVISEDLDVNSYLVCCGNCGHRGPACSTRALAISEWNSLPRYGKTAIQIIEDLISIEICSKIREANRLGFEEPLLEDIYMSAINYLIDNNYMNDGVPRCAWLSRYIKERIGK